MSPGGQTGQPQPDILFASATAFAARELREIVESGEQPGEVKQLQPALRRGLQAALDAFPGWTVDVVEKTLPLCHWKPRPSGVDAVVRDPEARARYAAELKMRKTDECLWDLFKMVDARHDDMNADRLAAAYLVVGATDGRFLQRPDWCADLFSGVRYVGTRALFEQNKNAWLWLLKGGAARPTELPHRSAVVTVAHEQLPVDDSEGSLRCVRIEGDWNKTVPFSKDWCDGDWPVGVEPHPNWKRWKMGEGQ